MKINHLGIATKGIDEALKFWGDGTGENLDRLAQEIAEKRNNPYSAVEEILK